MFVPYHVSKILISIRANCDYSTDCVKFDDRHIGMKKAGWTDKDVVCFLRTRIGLINERIKNKSKTSM
jgi:hypothetical protein